MCVLSFSAMACCVFPFFLSIDPPRTAIYTLSLHDALPISQLHGRGNDIFGGALENVRAYRGGAGEGDLGDPFAGDRKSTRLNSSHVSISYAVFCLKKKKK